MGISRKLSLGIVSALSMLLPIFAHAHTSTIHDGWLSGWSHPFSGADHLCAMLAVGLWAVQLGGKAIWRVPLTFVSAMLIGGILAMLAIPLPFIESGIVMSVLILGVLLAAAVNLPLVASTFIVATFAVFHGYAHGLEMSPGGNTLGYISGFLLATAVLHVVGIAAGWSVRQNGRETLLRYAGGLVAACGGYLWLTV